MTDTNTLAPADAEILDAAEDFRSQYTHGGTTFDEFDEMGFARAVLAKWGQPQAGAGEPVAVIEFTDGVKEPRIMSWNALPAGQHRVYTTPQPTQAQAGAVPLTDEQINTAGKKMAECMDYPWAHMPEQGRAEMCKHAQAVIGTAYPLRGNQ